MHLWLKVCPTDIIYNIYKNSKTYVKLFKRRTQRIHISSSQHSNAQGQSDLLIKKTNGTRMTYGTIILTLRKKSAETLRIADGALNAVRKANYLTV